MNKFILGKKQGMSQIFGEDGRVIPVTIIKVEPNIVTQVKTTEKEGYNAVQVGFGETKPKRLKKPQLGHLEGLNPTKTLKEFRLEKTENYKKGDKITVEIFEEGELVRVSGRSHGRGFQGVVKRHGFSGGPASHGHRHVLRAPGSIGGRFPQRVMKGKRMAGRMGNDRVTLKNLPVVRVDKKESVIFLGGAIPGKRDSVVEVTA